MKQNNKNKKIPVKLMKANKNQLLKFNLPISNHKNLEQLQKFKICQ